MIPASSSSYPPNPSTSTAAATKAAAQDDDDDDDEIMDQSERVSLLAQQPPQRHPQQQQQQQHQQQPHQQQPPQPQLQHNHEPLRAAKRIIQNYSYHDHHEDDSHNGGGDDDDDDDDDHDYPKPTLQGKKSYKIPLQQSSPQPQTQQQTQPPQRQPPQRRQRQRQQSHSPWRTKTNRTQRQRHVKFATPPTTLVVEDDDDDDNDDNDQKNAYPSRAWSQRQRSAGTIIAATTTTTTAATEAPPPPLQRLVWLACSQTLSWMVGLVLVPWTVVPLLGGTAPDVAHAIGTTYVVTGLTTVLQTTYLGHGLPVVAVTTSLAYLPPTLWILFVVTSQYSSDREWPDQRMAEDPNPSRVLDDTMSVVSGSILVAGAVQVLLSCTNLVALVLPYISPVTIACVTTVLGLGFYDIGFAKVATCYPMGLTVIVLAIVLSSILMTTTTHPNPNHRGSTTMTTTTTTRNRCCGRALSNYFSLLPLLLALGMTWSMSAVLTQYNLLDDDSLCRTDGTRPWIEDMPMIRFPLPRPWHGLRFEWYGIIPMLGAVLVNMVQCVGDYHTCARVSGAPPPTPGILCRGLAVDGVGVMLAGWLGQGCASTTTSGSSSNISSSGDDLARLAGGVAGARAVVQLAALLLMVVGVLAKVSATMASLPPAMVGGIFCLVLGSLVAGGLNNLQLVPIRNNDRNLFIMGFAMFNALSIAGPGGYLSSRKRPSLNHDSIQDVDDPDMDHDSTEDSDTPWTDSSSSLSLSWGEITLSLLRSPMVVALIFALILDNTIPGTKQERGLHAWAKARHVDVHTDPAYVAAYGLPRWWASPLSLVQSCLGAIWCCCSGRDSRRSRYDASRGGGGEGGGHGHVATTNHSMPATAPSLRNAGPTVLRPALDDDGGGDDRNSHNHQDVRSHDVSPAYDGPQREIIPVNVMGDMIPNHLYHEPATNNHNHNNNNNHNNNINSKRNFISHPQQHPRYYHQQPPLERQPQEDIVTRLSEQVHWSFMWLLMIGRDTPTTLARTQQQQQQRQAQQQEQPPLPQPQEPLPQPSVQEEETPARTYQKQQPKRQQRRLMEQHKPHSYPPNTTRTSEPQQQRQQ